MAKIPLQILITISLFIYTQCEAPEQCVQDPNDYCTCRFQDERKIDISKLFPQGKNTTETRFLEADRPNFRFFFHGCMDATFKPSDYNITLSDNSTTELKGSLILHQNWSNNGTSHSTLTRLGNAADIEYHVLENEQEPYELIYRNRTDRKITATFRLICEKYEKPYIQIIDDPQSRQFTLNSPHVCIVREPEESSFGSKLLLIFMIFCLFYFIGGGCVLYFVRGARGAEVIPHIDFWRRLPGLVRDGTLFVFSGCNPNYVSSAEAYDRI
ncbi:hypothetical protein HHI36_014133 [Cryptolaemus montrouzieri]|uniref:Cation-dependent mannose-6-phosphate receptor n=1 Tax=Cryptolaemus montrouzieri TaxID=559131 RepID=A0ABD2N205_9CUCU